MSTFDNSPAIKSRQITNLAYIWPKCMPKMAYIQSDNHANSRSITPNHGIRQIMDSDKPNVAKLCLHTECSSERLHLINMTSMECVGTQVPVIFSSFCNSGLLWGSIAWNVATRGRSGFVMVPGRRFASIPQYHCKAFSR